VNLLCKQNRYKTGLQTGQAFQTRLIEILDKVTDNINKVTFFFQKVDTQNKSAMFNVRTTQKKRAARRKL